MNSVPGNQFRRDRTGWIIVSLNLLMAANSTFYFTGVLGAGLDGWLAMNSCAPSIVIFAIGYILRQRSVMAVGAGCMFRFGTLGLFAFGWEGMNNLIPQAGHILMTVAVIYFIVRMIRVDSAGALIIACLSALLLLYSAWQWEWFRNHPQILDHLMKGTLSPEMLRPPSRGTL
jgi:hypothetical protein